VTVLVNPLKQAGGYLVKRTVRRGLLDITGDVRSWLDGQSITSGLMTLFCTHTSASLLIQENAAPEVRSDLEAFFDRIAPEDADLYDHDEEGLDDMPAHLKAALTQVQVSIPVIGGKLALGTWQGIYLFEHRRRPHERRIALHVFGE
jgi:secondary thiamine-phosphate synthase enzyme